MQKMRRRIAYGNQLLQAWEQKPTTNPISTLVSYRGAVDTVFMLKSQLPCHADAMGATFPCDKLHNSGLAKNCQVKVSV